MQELYDSKLRLTRKALVGVMSVFSKLSGLRAHHQSSHCQGGLLPMLLRYKPSLIQTEMTQEAATNNIVKTPGLVAPFLHIAGKDVDLLYHSILADLPIKNEYA
ncbi:hypothetical protein PMIN03_009049 [Paraphaeosphaeria minitans]